MMAKEMVLPKDPRYLKYPLEDPFDQEEQEAADAHPPEPFGTPFRFGVWLLRHAGGGFAIVHNGVELCSFPIATIDAGPV